MTFRIRTDKQFNDGGMIFTTQIVAKKVNGYKVISPEGNVTFICNDDIQILSMSETEKNMPIEL